MTEINGESFILSSATSMSNLCTSCLICGEDVQLTYIEEMVLRSGNSTYKVCDKCRNAVKKMRELTHQEYKGE